MRTVVLILMFVVACGGKKDEERQTPPVHAGSGSAQAGSANTPVTDGVVLFVGDEQVATVTIAQAAAWPRLDTLVPEGAQRLGKWQAIATKGARTAELSKPFETYRDYVPALFPGEGGKIAFGLFDPVEYGKRGNAALREEAVTELRIVLDASGMRGGNDHGGGESIDPAKLELEIKTATTTKKMTGTELLAIPREPAPGGNADVKGWKLGTILTAAGIKTFVKLRLYDAGGTTLPIEKADLGADSIPFLKLNRQGSLRFRLYKKEGDGWRQAGDLRSLAKIEILQ